MSPDFFVPAVQYSVCRCNIELALIGQFWEWITGKMAFFEGKMVLARDLRISGVGAKNLSPESHRGDP